MLVSHRKKFIFTRTAKTAGTSVEVFFEKFCMPEGEWEASHRRDVYQSAAGIIGYRGPDPHPHKFAFWNHMPAEKIRAAVGEELWNEYFKFTVIRNPFSKLVSGWMHLRKPKRTLRKTVRSLAARPSEAGLLLIGRRDIHDFRAWVRSGGAIIDRDKYLIDDKICVDYFIRFESLTEGIEEVCRKLELPRDTHDMPRYKSGNRHPRLNVRDFYDRETEGRVRENYAFELEIFGYEMP